MTEPSTVTIQSPFGNAGPSRFDPARFEARMRALPARSALRFGAREVPDDFGRSSVLIAFWHEAEDVRVLLTRRAATLRTQAGQMSFPGGRLEPGEDWVEGALRETDEEVAIPPGAVDVLGRLDDAWSGARHHLVPIVGWLAEPPAPRPNPSEVDSIHTPTVSSLLPAAAYSVEPVEIDGETFHNATLRWAEGEHVFGLSTDLLIEAIQWGLGIETRPGNDRRASLRAWLRSRGELR